MSRESEAYPWWIHYCWNEDGSEIRCSIVTFSRNILLSSQNWLLFLCQILQFLSVWKQLVMRGCTHSKIKTLCKLNAKCETYCVYLWDPQKIFENPKNLYRNLYENCFIIPACLFVCQWLCNWLGLSAPIISSTEVLHAIDRSAQTGETTKHPHDSPPWLILARISFVSGSLMRGIYTS